MSGISVSEENSEHASAMEMVTPTSLSQVVSSVPEPTTRGRKTMRVVAVEAVTAMTTWPAPSRAALRRSPSSRILRSMLSRTTMALSTSIPTASIRPIIERMLRLEPMKYMTPQVAMMENGIDMATMTVESIRRRKNHRLRVARSAPVRPAFLRPSMPEVISSPWSCQTQSWMPLSSGSLLMSSSTTRLTSRTTSTVLAVDSL